MSRIRRGLVATLAVLAVSGATVGLVQAGVASALPPIVHDPDVAALHSADPNADPQALKDENNPAAPAPQDLNPAPAPQDLNPAPPAPQSPPAAAPATLDPAPAPAPQDLNVRRAPSTPAARNVDAPAAQEPPADSCPGRQIDAQIDALPITFTDRHTGRTMQFGEVNIFGDGRGDVCAQTVKSAELASRQTTTEVYVQPCRETAAGSGCTVQAEQAFWYSENRIERTPPVAMYAGGGCVQVVGKVYSGPDRQGDVATATSKPICKLK